MTGRIVLIQCTKTKQDEPTQARYLYDKSTLFTKMRKYAKAKADAWYILSAKHGLLSPDQTVAPYDEVGLSEQQAKDIAAFLTPLNPTVEIIAGESYTQHLVPELQKRGIEVHEPCCGMEIGERMQWLDTQTKDLTHQTW